MKIKFGKFEFEVDDETATKLGEIVGVVIICIVAVVLTVLNP